MKSSKEIRQAWIDYFVSKNHLFIESKSLIPYKDPSLLWINSGVATLKDYFSGKKKPPAKRLTNSQKSLRTNDIENVGVTARHHTFFEMLGNFSIGDYFKNEAIEFAYEVVTKIFELDINKIYITFFEKDLEVKQKWLSLGIKENHLIAGTKKTNFWDVGSGPCGPNTEIFYDRGEKFNKGGPELIANDIENDRFIEIWNIVFSEFNNLGNNQYVELAQKNIDTGAGLERIVSILQDGPTNFDTDLFLPIIREVEKKSKYKYVIENYFLKDKKQEIINKNFKIIADHMRAITNTISDGEKPSNTMRGYIIRRLIRRAYYAGKKLEIKEPTFLHTLVKTVVDSLIFEVDIKKVEKIILAEEQIFSKTIEQGKKLLEEQILKTRNDYFDVNIAFKLYETYGFPIEMTKDILTENNLKIDFNKLEELKQKHSIKSKNNDNKSISFDKQIKSLTLINKNVSEFIGYDNLENRNAKILYLLDENQIVKKSNKNDISFLIIDKTPFYATSGGQHCDKGFFVQNNEKIEVLDVFKDKNNNHIHAVKGKIDSLKNIEAYVDKETRIGLMRNHSATHLTFAALRDVYGREIEQLGSDNNEQRLTFDFPLEKKPTEDEIEKIENLVREIIKKNVKRNYVVTTIEEAKKMNAIMTIEESEYLDPKNIRIVEFPNITSDLCGGTHVDSTKQIENFKIVSVDSKGTGIYRIKAISSNKIVNEYLENEKQKYLEILKNIYIKYESLFKTKKTKKTKIIIELNENISKEEQIKMIRKNIDHISEEIKNLIKEPNKIDDNYVYQEIKLKDYLIVLANEIERNSLKEISVNLREKNVNKIIVCCSRKENEKYSVIICSKTINISQFVKEELITKINDLRGGGNKLIWQGVSSIKIDQNILK